jgi:hypothetical protein
VETHKQKNNILIHLKKQRTDHVRESNCGPTDPKGDVLPLSLPVHCTLFYFMLFKCQKSTSKAQIKWKG